MSKHAAPVPLPEAEPWSPRLAFYSLTVFSLLLVIGLGIVRLSVGL